MSKQDGSGADRRRFLAMAGAGIGLCTAGPARSQDGAYPNRPIRVLVGYSPGGAADVLGRILAAGLGRVLGQSVVVENRPGAGGTLAASLLAAAPADGYTLYSTSSAILVGPAIYGKVAYDPRQLTPVAGVGSLPYCVVVNPQFPARTVAELIAVLKASPGKYTYASPGVGNIGHLGAELFKQAAGVDLVHVPYKGGGPALADVMAGQVPIAFVSLTPVLPLAKSGQLRLLAVTTAGRVDMAPDVPAISETLPGFDAAANLFVMAPPGTPTAIVTRLNEAIVAAMTSPEVRRDYRAQGASVHLEGPAALAKRVDVELGAWSEAVKRSGAKLE